MRFNLCNAVPFNWNRRSKSLVNGNCLHSELVMSYAILCYNLLCHSGNDSNKQIDGTQKLFVWKHFICSFILSWIFIINYPLNRFVYIKYSVVVYNVQCALFALHSRLCASYYTINIRRSAFIHAGHLKEDWSMEIGGMFMNLLLDSIENRRFFV